MKTCVILYHKNINKIYKSEWIEECIKSILNQTYKDYYVYDLNYGPKDNNVYFNFQKYFPKNYKFYQKKFKNHVGAMNFLIDECVKENFDAVFNINLDDYYHEDRFKLEIEKIKEGYDIVSSNFNIMRINNGEFVKTDSMIFDNKPIIDQFNVGNNVIAHPCVCYSKKFIENNRYLDEIPEEDFKLWKRTISDYKYYICKEFLLNYRIHENQITYKTTVDSKKEIIPESPLPTPSSVTIQGKSSYICEGEVCRFCGFPKNKVKYNFCQKCNKLY